MYRTKHSIALLQFFSRDPMVCAFDYVRKKQTQIYIFRMCAECHPFSIHIGP